MSKDKTKSRPKSWVKEGQPIRAVWGETVPAFTTPKDKD